MGGLDDAIKKRLKKAMGVDFEQAVEVMEMILPALEKGMEGDTYAIELAATAARLNEEIKVYLTSKQSGDRAMVGQLKETMPILRDAKYELAHIMTLEDAREYFMQADLKTVLSIMKAFDRKVRTDAMVLLNDSEFASYQEDIKIAEARREALT